MTLLSRLAWAAAYGSRQMAQIGASNGGSVAFSLASRSHQATQQPTMSLWRQACSGYSSTSVRQFTSANSSQGTGMPRNILESAAEAQMQKLKTKEHSPAAPTMVSRFFGVMIDSMALTAAGFLLFSGYYTWAHREVSELDSMLKEAKESLSIDKPAPPALPPPGPGAPPPVPADLVPSRKGPEVAPSSFPPVTVAWCFLMERYLGIRKYVEKSIKDFRDPTYDKLLPDMAPELKGRIKTLVLDLDDLLVHKEWTRQTGWKIYKRPGVQDFLLEMGGYYEVVVFTDTPATYAEPIISKLDPHRVVLYRLYRPETQYHNGKHVRDLSKLNRDLSQVLMISANPDAWEFQPENTLKLKAWAKETDDTTLLDLIPMLQLIATKGVRDVRDVVRSYDGEDDIPRAFKARMQQIAGHQKQPKQRGLLGSLAK